MTARDTRALLTDPATFARLCAHAAAWYPRECCALLFVGPDGPELVLADNLADTYHALDPDAFPRGADRAFLLDSRLILAGERRGQTLVAIIHSHVDAGAYFSAEDAQAATASDGATPLFPDVDHVVLDARADGVRGLEVFAWSAEAAAFVPH